MGANRTARTRPAQTEGHAPRLRISNAIYLIACSAYLYCARGTFYINHQRTEISTCTMQVQPGPAGNGAPTHLRGAQPGVHQDAAPGNITSNTRPRQALAMCSAAARVGQRGRFGAKRCPAGCAAAWCANNPARAAAGPVPRPPPFWRQHSKCTCGAAAWCKASSSIT